MNCKYPKEEKLKSKKEISLLFDKGKWKSYGNLRIIVLKNPSDFEMLNTKVGVSVSKRNFKKAVDRNRIKRLLRACYRLNKEVFLEKFGAQSLAMLFYISSEFPNNLKDIEKDFLKLCEK